MGARCTNCRLQAHRTDCLIKRLTVRAAKDTDSFKEHSPEELRSTIVRLSPPAYGCRDTSLARRSAEGLSVAAVEEAQIEGALAVLALGTEECTKKLRPNHLECAAVRTCKAECVSSQAATSLRDMNSLRDSSVVASEWPHTPALHSGFTT